MDNNKKKSNKLKIVTLILMILLVLTGTSYAIITWSYEGKTDNLLSTPDISFRFLESNKEVIGIENGVPMTDEQGMNQTGTGNVFDFEVKSKFNANTDVKYTVSLEKLTIDSGKTQIPEDEIKIYVEDFEGKTVLKPTKISDLDNYNLFIKTDRHSKDNEEISSKYRLKVWLDESVDVFTNQNRQYKFKINVGTTEQEQNKDQTYNLVYNLNGGTGNISSTSFKVGNKVTITSTVPTKDGYKFLGWSTNKNNSNAEYTSGEQVSLTNAYNNTVTLYAIWQQDIVYTVKYNPNGGSLDIGFTSTTSNYVWEYINGVYRSGNYNVNSSTSTMKSDEFTLTESSDISFDWAVSSESASYDYLYYTIYKDGTALSGTGTSTKIGGYTSSDTEENLTYKTVTKTLEAGTYYIEFSYRKDSSAHKGLDRGYVKNLTIQGYVEDKTMEDSTFEGGTNKLSKNKYKREHYTFKGWSLSKDATSATYQDEQEVGNLTKQNNDIVNLYAVWEKEKFTVNVVVQNGTVDTSSKEIPYDENGTFNLTTNVEGAMGSVMCTNNQIGKVENNILTVSNVSASTTCTIKFATTFTTLYEDGTLVINERAKDKNTNLSTHGNIIKEYDSMDTGNSYVMSNYDGQPWKDEYNSIKSVEIGQKIEPISTAYWFKFLNYMEKGDFTNLDTSNVTNMDSMFYSASSSATTFELNGLNNWNTSKVTNMSAMFYDIVSEGTTFNLDISNWDTSSVTDMSHMFAVAGGNATTFELTGLNNWNTSKVTNMSAMFSSAGKSATTFKLDLSNWDTSSVTSMSYMFSSAGKSATTFNLNLSNWDTSSVTSMSAMFSSAGKSATAWNIGNISNWNTSSVTNMNAMFSYASYSATTWSIGDLSSWNTSSVTNMNSMFSYASYSATTWSIGDLSSWDVSKVTNMNSMFSSAGYRATTWSIGDLSSWDVSSVTNMSSIFSKAGYGATTWSIGNLSSWDVSSVTDMGSMFTYAGYGATTWSIGDLSNWNTSSVTNMNAMFSYAGNRATTWSIGDLSSWDVSSVTDMGSMFSYAGRNATTFELKGLSNWDTSSVVTMYKMFYYAGYSATTFNLDLSNWDTSSVTDMENMFYYAGYSATTFNLDLSNWDTSSVTDMKNMFYKAGTSATTWTVKIPSKTGSLTNTTSKWYGSSESVYASTDSGKSFTLA